MLQRSIGFVLSLVFCLASGYAFASKGQKIHFELDPSHSTVGFKVKHLGVSTVRGQFKGYKGSLVIENGKLLSAEAVVKVDSVDTENEKRDKHLKEEDFFAAAKHPEIIFKSTKITQDGNDITVIGDFTMRGVTRSITLKGELAQAVFVETWGIYKTGIELAGKINRQDYGLSFSKMLGTGELMVSDEVKLVIELEANGKK